MNSFSTACVGGGGFGSGVNNNNNNNDDTNINSGSSANSPVYRYAKGAATRASAYGTAGRGFPSSRSMGSMNDLHASGTGGAFASSGGDAAVSSSSPTHQQQAGGNSSSSSSNISNNNSNSSNIVTPAQIKQLVDPLVQAMKLTSFYDIMSNSSLVVVLDINSTVAVCVAAAQETRASSFLVWDPYCKQTGKGKFVAILTLTNFIQILIHCHENQDQVSQLSNMPLRELLKQDFAQAVSPRRQQQQQQSSSTGRSNINISNSMILHANPDVTLYDLLGIMIENSINHVPILADSDCCSSDQQQPTNLLGVSFLPQLLSQVVRIINNPAISINNNNNTNNQLQQQQQQQQSNSPPPAFTSLFDVPLAQLAGMSRDLSDKLNSKNRDGARSWLRADETVYVALQRLIEQGVQALPVINEHGAIIDTFSRADVIGLEDLGVYNLNQPCKLALDTRRKHRSIAVCHLSDTIGDVVAHFVATAARTIFVVSGSSDEFVGQIQVSDLLKFLYHASK